MKILCIADEEILDQRHFHLLKDIDLIISCGDLSADYLDYLMTLTQSPLIYVFGNHDKSEQFADRGGICIEDQLFHFKNLTILGLGGSIRYREGPHLYSEKQMKRRILRLSLKLRRAGKIDILVTHSPAKGYGDLPDVPHQGFECFNKLMNRFHPRYMFHGHIHTSYGRIQTTYEHPSGTRIMNVCGYQIIAL